MAAEPRKDPLEEARRNVAKLTGTLRRIQGHYQLPDARTTDELCNVMSDWIYTLERRRQGLAPTPTTQTINTQQPQPQHTGECPF